MEAPSPNPNPYPYVAKVEAVRRGGEWPPSTDGAPWLHRRWSTLDKKCGTMVEDRSVRVDVAELVTDADF